MAKRGRKPSIMTRDPIPTTRDPVIEPPKEEPQEPKKYRRAVFKKGPLAACSKCGHNNLRVSGKTVPNYATEEMQRYKTCPRCGALYLNVLPMTDAELAYWIPAENTCHVE